MGGRDHKEVHELDQLFVSKTIEKVEWVGERQRDKFRRLQKLRAFFSERERVLL